MLRSLLGASSSEQLPTSRRLAALAASFGLLDLPPALAARCALRSLSTEAYAGSQIGFRLARIATGDSPW